MRTECGPLHPAGTSAIKLEVRNAACDGGTRFPKLGVSTTRSNDIFAVRTEGCAARRTRTPSKLDTLRLACATRVGLHFAHLRRIIIYRNNKLAIGAEFQISDARSVPRKCL